MILIQFRLTGQGPVYDYRGWGCLCRIYFTDINHCKLGALCTPINRSEIMCFLSENGREIFDHFYVCFVVYGWAKILLCGSVGIIFYIINDNKTYKKIIAYSVFSRTGNIVEKLACSLISKWPMTLQSGKKCGTTWVISILQLNK